MTFRSKQIVDWWFGSLLLLALYLPVRGLGLLLRRDHSFATRRGCAVIKLVGAGSLFLAMPSMQAIRGQFPERRFFLVGTRAVANFAEPFGWFDEAWIIDDDTLARLILTSLRALWQVATTCDHLIDLEVHSRLTTVFSVLTGVRNRIGFVDEIVFWRRAYYTHMTFFNPQGPVYSFYDMLATWFGVERVDVRAFHAAFRASVLRETQPAGPTLPADYVVLAPGCSDLSRERRLLAEEWKDLLHRLGVRADRVVVLGASGDRELCAAVAGQLGAAADLAGQLSILQSARVLAGASRLLGIDSLLLHLARALDVPSVSIWGPSNPATLLRSGRAQDIVYFAEMACSPCIHVYATPPCRGARPCIPAALRRAPVHRADPSATAPAIGWAIGPNDTQVREVRVSHD